MFGLIISGLGIACRYFYKLYKTSEQTKNEKEHQELIKEISQLISDNNKTFSETILKKQEELEKEDAYFEERLDKFNEEISFVKKGVLSLQGRSFKTQCRELLDPNHVISLSEYELISEEHDVYNSLGGNHEGDVLFDLVDVKYKQNLAN